MTPQSIRLPTQLHTRATACAGTLGISMSELARRGVRALKNHVGVDEKMETPTPSKVATIEIDATADEVRRGLMLAVETCEAATTAYSGKTMQAIRQMNKLTKRKPRVNVGRVLAKMREAAQ